MYRTLLTSVAAGALALGLSTAMAQTSTSSGSSSSAPGQVKPPATTSAPGRSESAPGQNRPDIATSAPGQSERAPGQNRDVNSTASSGASQDTGGQLHQGGKAAQTPASTSTSETKPSDTKSNAGQAQQRTGENGADKSKPSSAASSASQNGQDAPRTAKGSQSGESASQAAGGSKGAEQNSTASSSQQQPGSKSSATTQQGTSTGTASSGQANQSTQSGQANATTTGSTSAVANLNTQQRTEVTRAFTSTSVQPVNNVNFSVSVGTTVTDEIRLSEVPADVVRIVPQYRGYRYFVVRDEVVIVEPRTKKIVEVIHKSGQRSASSRSASSIKLSAEQRKTFRDSIQTTGSTRSTSTKVELREGAMLPESVELQEVPQTIITEAPELRTYRYVVIGDEIGLVDPDSREVVTIIHE